MHRVVVGQQFGCHHHSIDYKNKPRRPMMVAGAKAHVCAKNSVVLGARTGATGTSDTVDVPDLHLENSVVDQFSSGLRCKLVPGVPWAETGHNEYLCHRPQGRSVGFWACPVAVGVSVSTDPTSSDMPLVEWSDGDCPFGADNGVSAPIRHCHRLDLDGRC
jgi:hypothetical protein